MEENQQEDIFQYIQEGNDVYVRDDEQSEEEDVEINQDLIQTQNADIEQFMASSMNDSSPQQIMKPSGLLGQDTIYDIERMSTMIRTGNFQKALSFIQNKLMSNSGQMPEEELLLYNESLVYVFFKLKKFQNAKILSEEIISKLSKQILFSVHTEDDTPFPLRYLYASSCYELKNVKEALKIMYKLIRETEAIMRQSQASQHMFTLEKETNQDQFYDEDDFGMFTKKEITVKNIESQDLKDQVKETFKKEKDELFGLFPPRDQYDSKLIMLYFEICRIHSRQQDYRNAYKIMQTCVKKYPLNPHVTSRMIRLCLEVGKKQEALEYFNQIQKQMVNSPDSNSPKGATEEGFQNILDDDNDQDISVLFHMNKQKGFLNIYDGNYKEAIENFRKIQMYKPQNIVAANNMATCQIFCNETQRAIELIEKFIKQDPRKNINEQTISNLMSLYDIQYPFPNQQKGILSEFCNKNAKDNVNAALYISVKSQPATSTNTSIAQSQQLGMSQSVKK